MVIGEVPFSGKLKSKPSISNNFIGFLQAPSRLGDINLMYFRDYTLDSMGNPTFFDITIDENKTYHFDIGFLRIPRNFNYLLVSDDNEIHTYKHQQRYYGVAIFNIHEYKRGSDIRPTDSLAVKTYVLPNRHYKAENVGGLRGCKSLVSFGFDKVPLFGIDNGIVTKCYMLTIGTEATAGFCQFVDEEEMKLFLKELSLKSMKVYPDKRLGITLHEYERYDVDDTESKYGVHITPPRIVTPPKAKKPKKKKKKRKKTFQKGWDLGWYINQPY